MAVFTRVRERYERLDVEGEHAGHISSIVAARDSDRILYIHGGASDPDHVMAARLDGPTIRDQKEILRPNKGFKSKPLARTKIIRWKGSLDEAETMCDCIGLLHDGRLVAEGNLESLRKLSGQERLSDIFLKLIHADEMVEALIE